MNGVYMSSTRRRSNPRGIRKVFKGVALIFVSTLNTLCTQRCVSIDAGVALLNVALLNLCKIWTNVGLIVRTPL